MRTITLTKREAKLLRDNLTASRDGYDYVDLKKLDWLSDKLTALQGDYAIKYAELVREEKQLRRTIAHGSQLEIDAANRKLSAIVYDAEDLDEEAEKEMVKLRLEESDYKLVKDKVNSVQKWLGFDRERHVIIGMVTAIENAESEDVDKAESKADGTGDDSNIRNMEEVKSKRR